MVDILLRYDIDIEQCQKYRCWHSNWSLTYSLFQREKPRSPLAVESEFFSRGTDHRTNAGEATMLAKTQAFRTSLHRPSNAERYSEKATSVVCEVPETPGCVFQTH